MNERIECHGPATRQNTDDDDVMNITMIVLPAFWSSKKEFSERHVRNFKIASVTLPKITDRHHRHPGRHPGKGGGWRNGIKGMVRFLSSSDVILFFRVTPHIHLTIIFSVLSNLCLSSTFMGHVSLPYTMTL